MYGIKINRVGRFTRTNTFLDWNDKNGHYGTCDKVAAKFTLEEARAMFPDLQKKYIFSISIVDADGNVVEELSISKLPTPIFKGLYQKVKDDEENEEPEPTRETITINLW